MEHTPDNPGPTPAVAGRAVQAPHLTDSDWQAVLRRMRDVASGEMYTLPSYASVTEAQATGAYCW